MKVGSGLAILAGSALLSIFVPGLHSQDRINQSQCTTIAISVSLKTDDSFQQRINDFTFKIEPLKSTGWMFSLEDAQRRDLIYPVNPPLRFNASQTLGAGYGDTAKQSLSYPRELRFLLSESDYEALAPYVEHALWPYTAPDPDHALDEYSSELGKLRTGLFRLTVVRSDVSENDEVRSADFKLEFIAPSAFQFSPSLQPHAAVCLESTLPINERRK